MMFRRLLLVGVAAGLCAASWTDLNACGDKFMRVGRAASGRKYAALHPSSILIYRPARSTSQGIAEFEALLKRAGHSPRVLQRGENIAPILATASYPLVIADYSDVEMLKQDVDAAPGNPGVLPILVESNKAIEARAKQDFHCLIKPKAMSDNDALAEIDHALDIRLKGIHQTR
jgi:hypothetical protein